MRAIHFPHLASQWLFLLLTMIALGGCSRSIGDTCETDQECPTASLCDVTVPNGYCTIPDCEIDSCPESSVCIRFDRETTNCMKYCENRSTCEEGQVCRHDLGPAGFCFFRVDPEPEMSSVETDTAELEDDMGDVDM